jgi:hypothetical protein
MATWIRLGGAGVDSGQLLVVDPCYLKRWRDGEVETAQTDGAWRVTNAGANDYAACCAATLGPTRGGEAGEGVAFRSGYGDGRYDIFGRIEGGVVTRVVVDLDGTFAERLSAEEG